MLHMIGYWRHHVVRLYYTLASKVAMRSTDTRQWHYNNITERLQHCKPQMHELRTIIMVDVVITEQLDVGLLVCPLSVTERFLLQPLVCGTVFHRTSLLLPSLHLLLSS